MSTRHPPNIIILYADDLGFGDIGCYGADGIPTPCLDRMAGQGLVFREAYATAATCTPSRYSLLTGSYPWRNKQAAILAGNAPLIIPPGTLTLASLLKQAGYATAVVGKWHLGIGRGDLDWNKPIQATPLDVGFDESFIMAATNDRVPCVYINGRMVEGLDPADPIEVTYDHAKVYPGLPTGRQNPELLRVRHSHGHDMSIVNGVGRIGYMRGGERALWKDEEMAETFLEHAVSFIQRNSGSPFFLYYALHQPHVPRLPGSRFAGTTPRGARGDVIAEMDWCVGEILDTLEKLGIAKETLVIFSSDNGPVLDDGYEDRARELCGNHRPAGPLRGGKYSMLDGGVRVPLLLRWPGTVPPGESSALVGQQDLLASMGDLVGAELDSEAAPDSLNLLPALLGKSAQGRHEMVTEGTQGRTVIRQDHWVFIPPHPGPSIAPFTGIEMGNAPDAQLYDLSTDLSQQSNVAGQYPEKAKAMSYRLGEILQSDMTRPV